MAYLMDRRGMTWQEWHDTPDWVLDVYRHRIGERQVSVDG